MNNSQQKKVSVIMPCYNQGKYIEEAIESILNQTYKNIELIIINDASPDNSSEIIKPFADKYNQIIFLDEKENKGVVQSRNIAINKASGEYILPVDADDKIEPTYIEKAVKILDEDKDVRIAYAGTMFFGEKNKEFKLGKFSPDTIIFNNCIPNTAMYRKEDFLKVGGYKDYMKDGWEDWNMWLSILEIAPNKEKCAKKIEEPLYLYRQLNTTSRSSFDEVVKNKLFVNMIVNHYELYSNLTSFYKHIVKSTPTKFKKYKNLAKNFAITSIIELIVIIGLIACIILK